MSFLGSNSGFRTARDFVLFVTGLGMCLFHIITTPASDLSITLLMFGGGMAGAPSVIRQDEKKERNNESKG